ncbi:isochorismatase family protein [Bosea psychrotolerans]|uniref:Nicotinamidase-related amidase n=1 Tax=Bosea psychrotolerans TaxID=1871628 RepID=A0A2S4MER9_9HYPH|nr:isochorismatase family protein [Bosea psychrotolerans]POR53161.1 nicotinamidase-related amidase [Bosea psychrotolerans]
MTLLSATDAILVVIDFQARLMPAIHDGARLVENARRLVDATGLLAVPVLMTEQNPAGLGGTVPELAGAGPVIAKMSFDSCAEPAFLEALAGDAQLVICGCEAHVCVGQTVLSLLEHRRRVAVVQDAIGSRAPESKEAAIARMARHGAEIVTTEMVVFEWLRTAAHPQFRAAAKLIR